MNIFIDMTALEGSEFGKLLRNYYYGNHRDLIELAPGRSGFPHDGGFHSMRIAGSVKDCTAFLKLFEERFPETTPVVSYVLDAISFGETRIVVRTNPALEMFRSDRSFFIEPTITKVN